MKGNGAGTECYRYSVELKNSQGYWPVSFETGTCHCKDRGAWEHGTVWRTALKYVDHIMTMPYSRWNFVTDITSAVALDPELFNLKQLLRSILASWIRKRTNPGRYALSGPISSAKTAKSFHRDGGDSAACQPEAKEDRDSSDRR